MGDGFLAQLGGENDGCRTIPDPLRSQCEALSDGPTRCTRLDGVDLEVCRALGRRRTSDAAALSACRRITTKPAAAWCRGVAALDRRQCADAGDLARDCAWSKRRRRCRPPPLPSGPPAWAARLAHSAFDVDVGSDGVGYHPQVAKDFQRLPHQWLATGNKRPAPIPHASDNFHEDVAAGILSAVLGEHASDTGLGDDAHAELQANIARALHTRTQTFEADVTTLLTVRLMESGAMGSVVATNTTVHYRVVGTQLRMTTFSAFQRRILSEATGAETRSLVFVRRAGVMDLSTGELADEQVYLSDVHPLEARDVVRGRPQGAFVADFGGFGQTAFALGEVDDSPFFIANDVGGGRP